MNLARVTYLNLIECFFSLFFNYCELAVVQFFFFYPYVSKIRKPVTNLFYLVPSAGKLP